MNNSGITPCGDRILVLPEKVEETSAGGIVIVDSAREKFGLAQTIGVLVAIGPEAWTDYESGAFAKVGDRVMFAKYGGLVFTGNDGQEYRVMNDVDITAIVSDDFESNQLKPREKAGRS